MRNTLNPDTALSVVLDSITPEERDELLAEAEAEQAKYAAAKTERAESFLVRDSVFVEAGISLNAQGQAPLPNMERIARVLRHFSQTRDSLWYDEFTHRVMTNLGGEDRELRDSDYLDILAMIQNVFWPSAPKTVVFDAIEYYAHRNPRNSVTEYLDGLKWDGAHRLRGWLGNAFGANYKHDKMRRYHECVGRNWLIAMVARAYRPGCQVDNVVVLEGPQGVGKSRALQVLGGSAYANLGGKMSNDKQFVELFRGKWLIELAELDSLNRSTIDAVKSTITTRVDTYRPPWGRVARDFARTCVLAGTCNRTDWLVDDTGNRRFWPVKCSGAVNFEWLEFNRDQLFAEAVHHYKRGRKWWSVPEIHALVTDARKVDDPWLDRIKQYLDDPTTPAQLTSSDVLSSALHIPMERQSRATVLRLTPAMRQLGYVYKAVRCGDAVAKRWVKEQQKDKEQQQAKGRRQAKMKEGRS